MITGFLYLNDSSKASIVSSSISCGEVGASTIARVVPCPSPRQQSLVYDCSGPHHVEEDRGKLDADHVGDALEHQAEAGRAGEGHGRQARAAAAVHVVDGRDLAARPQKYCVEPLQER